MPEPRLCNMSLATGELLPFLDHGTGIYTGDHDYKIEPDSVAARNILKCHTYTDRNPKLKCSACHERTHNKSHFRILDCKQGCNSCFCEYHMLTENCCYPCGSVEPLRNNLLIGTGTKMVAQYDYDYDYV